MNPTDHCEEINPSAAEAIGSRRSIGRRFGVFVPTAAILLVLGIVHGIHSRVEAGGRLQQMAQATAIPVVEVVYPRPTQGGEEMALPGNVQAFHDTNIYARANGYVEHWYADIGARVKQGQLLATIQTPELDQQLREAEADLQVAQANLEFAQIAARRLKTLVEEHAVSQQDTDRAVSDFKMNRARVDSNKANIERLKRLQEFERVTAPFDGVITARNTDIGDLIQAGGNLTPKAMFHLASIRQLRIFTSIPEEYAGLIKEEEPVNVTFDLFPQETFAGTVTRNSNAIDQNSRTLNLEVDMNNPTGRILPGAFAIVHFGLPANRNSLVIPSNALLFRAEGTLVGVVQNGHVVLKPLSIGQDYGSSVEVLTGLKPNERVIVNPPDSLEPGSTVRVRLGGTGGGVASH